MASRRWVITTPEPRTAKCPHCLRVRNRLSVYPTPNGKLCYSCLTSPYLAERSLETLARPAVATAGAASAMPSQKAKKAAVPVVKPARPTVCAEPGCARLPGHHGHHRPTLHRRPTVVAGVHSFGA